MQKYRQMSKTFCESESFLRKSDCFWSEMLRHDYIPGLELGLGPGMA